MRRMMFAAVAAMLATAPAAADERNFVLVNGTGYIVSELYLSPANVKSWEEDVLGVDVLGDGQRVKIGFSDDVDTCVYDLKIVHDDGDTAVWTGINLCEVSVVTAKYDAQGTPIAETE